MESVVVVHGDPETREEYASWLHEAGYRVQTCGGPEAPDFYCPVLKYCGCPSCEASDVMVYDPALTSQREHPASERIIYRLREWYPDKPIVVVNRGSFAPELHRLLDSDSGVTTLADPTPESVRQAVREAVDSMRAIG